jgi:regulator of cell morphogenesis and NO signaling
MNTKLIIEPVQPDTVPPDYIFYKFDSLLPGNGFIIHEDNDPHSIYSQMLKEKGDTFSWEYLAVGPKKWCVKISKREKENSDELLGELAVSDHRKALILRKYGLDFSFKGKRTLKEACTEKNISIKKLERELEAYDQQSLVYAVNYNSLELDYLTDFIITNHHQYTRKILLCIANELQENSKVICQHHANLLPVVEAYNQLNVTMNIIMQQEEQVLFPYIRFLVHVTRGKIVANALPSGSVKVHISKIESEHQKIGDQINYIRHLTSDYTLPHIEDSFYSKILQWLNEFDNDLHQHIHIETNILFRKALMLEQEYLATAQISNDNPDTDYPITNHLSSLL